MHKNTVIVQKDTDFGWLTPQNIHSDTEKFKYTRIDLLTEHLSFSSIRYAYSKLNGQGRSFNIPIGNSRSPVYNPV